MGLSTASLPSALLTLPGRRTQCFQITELVEHEQRVIAGPRNGDSRRCSQSWAGSRGIGELGGVLRSRPTIRRFWHLCSWRAAKQGRCALMFLSRLPPPTEKMNTASFAESLLILSHSTKKKSPLNRWYGRPLRYVVRGTKL